MHSVFRKHGAGCAGTGSLSSTQDGRLLHGPAWHGVHPACLSESRKFSGHFAFVANAPQPCSPQDTVLWTILTGHPPVRAAVDTEWESSHTGQQSLRAVASDGGFIFGKRNYSPW